MSTSTISEENPIMKTVMQRKEELINQNDDEQNKRMIINLKSEARAKALNMAPNVKTRDDSSQQRLTATELVAEAEILYQWLIKDLPV